MKNFNQLIMRVLFGACATLTLTACGFNSSNVDMDGKSSNAVFPEIKNASRIEGSYVNLENLRKVVPGLTKTQLYELIGVPHFSEAMFNVREWDYIFKFPQPSTTEPLVCQFKVMFDENKIARSYQFLPKSCAELLNVSAEEAVTPVVEKQTFNNVTLQSDAAFDFGQDKLKPEARNSLQHFTGQLEGKTIDQIDIVGHTDSIGMQQANLHLSERRAQAVRDFLIMQGVKPQYIQAHGVGPAYPIVSCEEKMSRSALIDCLAPNRRVDIRVSAH